MANKAYSALIDFASGCQIIERNANVMENFPQQGLSAHKAACKLIIFRLPGYFAPVSFFKRDSIRRNHDVAAFGKLRAVCLIGVAGETDLLVSQLLAALPGAKPTRVTVSEAGASVYVVFT